MTPPTDWRAWHDDYDDPTSDLSLRLAAVQRRLADAVDTVPPGPVRIVSLCAGQARDVVGALTGHSRAGDVVGRLVELDEHNVAVAREAVAAAGLPGLTVVRGDAGLTDAYLGAVPADVVLLCGILGNISDADVLATVRAAPLLCAAGATVIWTRGRWEPDLTPTIRAAFAGAGFEEVAFDSPGPGGFAVGTQRLRADPVPLRAGVRLFTFTR